MEYQRAMCPYGKAEEASNLSDLTRFCFRWSDCNGVFDIVSIPSLLLRLSIPIPLSHIFILLILCCFIFVIIRG